MSTRDIRNKRDIGLFGVRDIDALTIRGFEVIEVFSSDDRSTYVKARIPSELTRSDLDIDDNIVTYQLTPYRS